MTAGTADARGGPISAAERVQLLDVLRGVALFGVFLVNFTSFASAGIMSTDEQLLSLPTAALDLTLYDLIEWLFVDKANTLFAFLFGLGFYLQMQRLEARGVDFFRVYLRRLTVLLVIGTLHMFFLWTWDILHLYALAGFVLLAMRELSNRDLVALGLIFGLFARTMQEILATFVGVGGSSVPTNDNASVLLRQQISQSGDYLALVKNFFDWTVVDYLASGLILGWLLYALGRFLIGAWVGRHGWIALAREFLPGWRRLARWSLPLGLILEGGATLLAESPLLPDWKHRDFFAHLTHLLAVPVLSVGYVSALVSLFHTPRGVRLLAPFAWSGRMALTNYLTQSLVYGFVLFGIGPGLALAGRIGALAILVIAIVTYAMQMAFSRWWLGRFAYGPAEWVWRALTYRQLPAMRLK
ncbi:MAG TPA: DUF418 domain-containing protein [Steroidobacteraceae bacterium]|nr:DUF418 domain-containing protein [Steroidobacteraceae bacterium]